MKIKSLHNFRHQHLSLLCKEVKYQFSVVKRFGKLMSMETMLCLYLAFILPHFYCYLENSPKKIPALIG